MRKVAIIHGTKGNPGGNWFPWLKENLVFRGNEVYIPKMPTPDGQNLDNWIDTFQQSFGALTKETIIIGHSAGAVLLLRLLEKAQTPIYASIFVGGFIGNLSIPEYDLLNRSFVAEPFRWDMIRINAGKIDCFMGDNDPYVPREQGETLARRLHVEPHVIKNGGHLNAESGFTTFPQLLAVID